MGCMPVPSTYTYDSLIRAAQKGVSLEKDAICLNKACRTRGKLAFTGTFVSRGIIWAEGENGCNYEVTRIPLCGCRKCGSRFRVLPREVLPHKHFSLPVIETACWLSFEDNRGPQKAAAMMTGNAPHWTSIYHWQGDLGERVLEGTKAIGTVHVPASALVAESAKRFAPGLDEQWRRPVDVPADPRRNQRRQEQLEACLRLLLAASFLFKAVLHPLTAWSAWLTRCFHVFAWSFPSWITRTTFQIPESTGVLLASLEAEEISGEEQYHDPRSPPDSDLAIPTDQPPA